MRPHERSEPGELRRRAEQLLSIRGVDDPQFNLNDLQALVHELDVHRVELEMQNAALRESQCELELSRDRYANLYDFAPVGYATIDERGFIRQVNLTAAKMFNRVRAQLAGRNLADYLASQEKGLLFRELGRCRAPGWSATVEVELAASTGLLPRTVQLKMAPDDDLLAQEFVVRVAIIDITELREALQRAEDANQTKSRFLANVSHEIRTPMTAILGYADLLEDPQLAEQERHEYLAVIRRNGRDLLQLISDVLDLSRIEAGRLPIVPSACSPRQVVEEVLATFRETARDKHLRLAAEFGAALPAGVETDPFRLGQILVNLVGNALKFTAQGEVRVAVDLAHAQAGVARLRFRVTDTGIGIARERLAQIFEPMVQLDDSNTRHHGGAGLGLSISKRLAELLGGRLEVDSEPGRGSTFTLWIDAARTAESSPAPPPAAGAPPRLHGRVLVVDDARDVRFLVSMILHRAGLTVDQAESGEAACRRALLPDPGATYQLIFMDVQMPGMDGFETTHRLRQGGWHGPIVALTAHAMAGDRERCLAAGCNDYLSKPIDQASLLYAAARWIAAGEVSGHDRT